MGHKYFPPRQYMCGNIQPPLTRAKQIPHNASHSFDDNEYFIANVGCLQEMINNAISGHKSKARKCNGYLKLGDKSRNIISTAWTLSCSKCGYKSDSHKMYKTRKTKDGGYASTLNQVLGMALVKSPIGATVIREIFVTIGIDPGSHSGICGHT